jgi:hypothetical protein
MHIRKFMSALVIVAFLGATVLPVSADDAVDSLAIIGPAILGVALLITLVAVIGTRSKEKPQAETPGSNAYAALPAQSAETPALATAGPRHPVPAREVNPSAPRGASSFAMLCPQGSAGIAVACW